MKAREKRRRRKERIARQRARSKACAVRAVQNIEEWMRDCGFEWDPSAPLGVRKRTA